MSLDNFNHSTPENPDFAHSGDSGSTLHDGAESPDPGDDQGDGHPTTAIGQEEVNSHEEATIHQSLNPLHFLIQENDTDGDACKSIQNRELWQKMVNDPSSDESNETPLHIAARKGFVETAQLLLNAGADVNAKDDSGTQPLHRACEAGCDELVKALCGRKDLTAESNDDGWYPIHFASWEGLKKETVQLLVPDKEHLNAVESVTRWTPLNMAAWRGNDEVVSTLLGYDADHTLVDYDGWTPLIAAIKRRHYTTFELLLTHLKSHGQDYIVDIRDNQGMTGFMELSKAADEKDAPLQNIRASLAKIREFGSTFAIADNDGKTVLHHAMGSAVSVKDPGLMLKILFWAKDETILLEDDNRKTAFGVAFDKLNEPEDVELSETPSPTSVHEVNPDKMPDATIDRLKNNERLRDFLLCWLAQRVGTHRYAIEIMAKVPVILGEAESDRLKVKKWGLVEWTIFRRLPQVLLSHILASRKLGSGVDQHLSDETKELRKTLIQTLEAEDKAENMKAASRSPTAARERGKKMDDPGVEGGGKNKSQGLQDIKDILDFYLVETPTPSEDLNILKPNGERKGILEKLHAAIVPMRQDDRKFTTFVKTRNIEEVVYNDVRLETVEDTIQRFQRLLPGSNGAAEPTDQNADGFGGGFTWVHFPSTNIIWMTDIMKKIMKQSDCSRDEQQNLVSFLRTSWVQIPDKTSTARFMRPLYVKPKAGEGPEDYLNDEMTDGDRTKRSADRKSLPRSTAGSSGEEKEAMYFDSSALYMPFLSFSTFRKEQPSGGQNLATDGTAAEKSLAHPSSDPGVAEWRSSDHQELFKAYHEEAIHCSPTLDEFYYQFATNTESQNDQYFRNKGQTVTEHLHKNDLKNSLKWTLLRVSQLWIWVLGEKWMISATSCIDGNVDNRFVLDILAHLRERTDYGSRRGPKSPAELSKLIVEYCIGNFERKYSFDMLGNKEEKNCEHEGQGFGSEQRSEPSKATNVKTRDAQQRDVKESGTKRNERSIHQVFSDSINRIGREEAALFSKFLHKSKRDVVKDVEDSQSKTGGLWLRLKGSSRFLSRKSSSTSVESIEGNEDAHGTRTEPLTTKVLQEATQEAAQLLFDIKDVRDELNIMKTVAQFQLKVQSAMKQHAHGSKCAKCQNSKASTEDLAAEYVCNDITELDKVAEQIQESVRTTISLQESEIANIQAIEGVNEAKRMTVFTITSIVFLPLSFLSSLFALDVSSFLDAPTWSLVVIFTVPLPFLIWAAAYVYWPRFIARVLTVIGTVFFFFKRWVFERLPLYVGTASIFGSIRIQNATTVTARGPKNPGASKPPQKSNPSNSPQQKGDQNV